MNIESREKAKRLLGCTALAFLPALGATVARPGPWYRALKKPPFQPPAWVFGPVWMALYLTMGLAHYAFMAKSGEESRRKGTLFQTAQLGLNAAWAPLFFGLKRPDAAMADLALLIVAAWTTQREFRKASPLAGRLLYPYLAWLCFAAYLNGGVCWLNRE
jgi:tryptophan-rich sensory protein